MSNAIEITVKVPEFNRAIELYSQAITNHDLPYILNRAGRNVATKASHNTPKATAEEITSQLKRPSGRPGYGPWLFVLTNAKRKRMGLLAIGGKSMSEPSIDFLKKRRSSKGYIAAGWTPAIIKFGGHTRAHIANRSKINQAVNILATASDLVAYLENAATGAGKVGAEALEKALVDTSNDMIAFAEKRLQETASKFSTR